MVFVNDPLKMFSGKPYQIEENVFLKMISPKDIEEFGESEYMSMVFMLCSSPYDNMYFLHKNNIDWKKYTRYSFFCDMVLTIDANLRKQRLENETKINRLYEENKNIKALFRTLKGTNVEKGKLDKKNSAITSTYNLYCNNIRKIKKSKLENKKMKSKIDFLFDECCNVNMLDYDVYTLNEKEDVLYNPKTKHIFTDDLRKLFVRFLQKHNYIQDTKVEKISDPISEMLIMESKKIEYENSLKNKNSSSVFLDIITALMVYFQNPDEGVFMSYNLYKLNYLFEKCITKEKADKLSIGVYTGNLKMEKVMKDLDWVFQRNK